MNALIATLLYVLTFGIFWLVPLYFVCRWSKGQRKDYYLVGIVGLLTSWLIALFVALLLPTLDDAKFAAIGKKSQKEPMGEASIFLVSLGVCSAFAVAFMAWMKWAL